MNLIRNGLKMMNKLKIVLLAGMMLSITACDKIGAWIDNSPTTNLSCNKVFDDSVKVHMQYTGRLSKAYDVKGNMAGYVCVRYEEFKGLNRSMNSTINCVDSIVNEGAFGVESSDKQKISTVTEHENGSVECIIRNLNYEVPFKDANFIAKEYYPISVRFMYYPYKDRSGYDFTYEAMQGG